MKYYFSIFDLIPYILLFSFLYMLAVSNNKNKLRNIAIVVVVFLGIRYGIGYDYFQYREWILDPTLKSQEPLAQYFAEFSSKIHYQLFFLITSVLTIFPVYYISKKYSINPIMSFMVYMLVPMLFLDGMSTIRNAVAYPMVLWAFLLLLQKEHKYLAIIPLVIAIGFHNSAIVALLFLPFAFFKIKRKTAILLWGISFMFTQKQVSEVLLDYMGLPFLSKASWYLAHSGENESGGMLWIAVNAINLINFWYWDELKHSNVKCSYYLMAYNLGCILYNLTIRIDPTMALRLSNFGSIFLMLIAPSYIFVLPFSKLQNLRVVYLFFIAFFCSLLFIVILTTPPGEKMSFFPYQTIFYHTDYQNL